MHIFVYSVLQAPTELAIVQELGRMLRNGSIGSKGQKFDQVVGVGHSYGAILVTVVLSELHIIHADDRMLGPSSNSDRPGPVRRCHPTRFQRQWHCATDLPRRSRIYDGHYCLPRSLFTHRATGGVHGFF